MVNSVVLMSHSVCYDVMVSLEYEYSASGYRVDLEES